MNDIDLTIPAILDRTKVGDLAKPEHASFEIAKTDTLIEFAKKVHDWPLLESAIDHKIAQQEEFVRWWREKVRRPGQGNNAERDYFSVDYAEEQTGITQPQVSKWSKRLGDKPKYRATLFSAAYRKAMAERGQTDQRGASGTGENEWYTPPEYIEFAREVLGDIDLDPASSEAAQNVVKAAKFFTKDDDGLKQDWNGRVWLNPPYAQPHIADFVSKMVNERRSGRVTAGIMLTHNYTDTAWFHQAAPICDAICFPRGRVKFYSPDGGVAAPTQGQAFFYFGDDVELFAATFGAVGVVVTPHTGEVDDAA